MYREGRGKRREGKSKRARACERVCVFYLVHRTIHGRGIVGYSVGTRRGHGIGEDVVDFNGYARGQRYTRVGGGEGMCVARVGSWFFDFFRIEDELSSLHELGYIYIWLCIFGKLAVSKVIPFFDTSVASLSSQLHAKPCCLYHASRELACFTVCLQGEFRFHVAAFIERDNKRRIIKVRMLFRVVRSLILKMRHVLEDEADEIKASIERNRRITIGHVATRDWIYWKTLGSRINQDFFHRIWINHENWNTRLINLRLV